MSAINIAIASLLFMALRYFGVGMAAPAAPAISPGPSPPPALESGPGPPAASLPQPRGAK